MTTDYNNHAFVTLLKYVTKKVTYTIITAQNGRLLPVRFSETTQIDQRKTQKNPDKNYFNTITNLNKFKLFQSMYKYSCPKCLSISVQSATSSSSTFNVVCPECRSNVVVYLFQQRHHFVHLQLHFYFTPGLKPTSFTNPTPLSFTSSSRTASTDFCLHRFFWATRFLILIFSLFFVSGPCARLSWQSRQLLSAHKSTVSYRTANLHTSRFFVHKKVLWIALRT